MDQSKSTAALPPRKKMSWYITRLLRSVLIAVAILLMLVTGLLVFMMSMPGRSWNGPLPPLTPRQTELEEQLRADVEFLCKFGGRGTQRPQALQASADWLHQRVTELGYVVTRQDFQADGQTCTNIIAEKTGQQHPDEIVIIGAHYDSVWGLLGANDNGSGVAALLAIAAELKNHHFSRTLRLVFFVNEEPPHYHTETMGSLMYARACRARNENIVAMMALDGLGYYSDAPDSQQYPPPFKWFYPTTANFIGFAGDIGSRGNLRTAIGAFRKQVSFPSEGIVAPQQTPGLEMSDHWSFWQAGYSGMLVTDTLPFRYKHYHTPGDTPDKLDYERMARVVDGLCASVTALTR